MNIRNWVKFYLSTLILGGIVTIITGFLVQWNKYKPVFAAFDIVEILLNAFWLVGVGFIFATLSHMGYFAYLTVHRFGLQLFRSLWNPVQYVLIAFVLFDLVYFRYQFFANDNDSLLPYILLALLVLAVGSVVAFLKMKQANKQSFVPALFFMVVVTTIEWVPVLRINEEAWLYLMLFPLLFCNAFQLLKLPKYIERSNNERVTLKNNKEIATKA